MGKWSFIFLASFSSFKTAQVVARILLSLPPLYDAASSEDVVLLEHDAAINIFKFQEFVNKISQLRFLLNFKVRFRQLSC
jgi:hypothetical protein